MPKTLTLDTAPTASEAIKARNDILTRLDQGEAIDPNELIQADLAIKLADQVDENRARIAAETAEAERLDKIDTQRAEAAKLADQYRTLTAKYRAAVTALAELHAAAEAAVTTSRSINSTLNTLRPFPDDAHANLRDIHTFAGVRLSNRDLTRRAVEAAAGAIEPALGNHTARTAIDRIITTYGD